MRRRNSGEKLTSSKLFTVVIIFNTQIILLKHKGNHLITSRFPSGGQSPCDLMYCWSVRVRSCLGVYQGICGLLWDVRSTHKLHVKYAVSMTSPTGFSLTPQHHHTLNIFRTMEMRYVTCWKDISKSEREVLRDLSETCCDGLALLQLGLLYFCQCCQLLSKENCYWLSQKLLEVAKWHNRLIGHAYVFLTYLAGERNNIVEET